MKRVFLIVISLVYLSCTKEENLVNSSSTDINLSYNSSLKTYGTFKTDGSLDLNVKVTGTKGDGVTDDTKGITDAIIYARKHGLKTVWFPAGTYSIQQTGITTGIIPLLDGVSLKGAGKDVCHIVLSGGRYNPNSIFYQAFWNEPMVNNIIIEGIDFNGNLDKQNFDTSYQFCHALSINNGSNIEVRNCLFQSFRGDGVLFGDTFLPSKELRMTYNVSVHDNEFKNIYREGAMFCCIKGAAFYNNYVHGNGYLVGGVDIERHGANETVLDVSVYNNVFDFTDGYGPVERGGPKVKYRRAVTMGYFYDGYPNGTVDNRAGGHKIYSNKIFQGQIDCWGHTNVSITENTFNNSYEDITGVTLLSAPTINISDPTTVTIGLTDVIVSNNSISSKMGGNAIFFNHYKNVVAKSNAVQATQAEAINIYNSSGLIDSNWVVNVGTITKRVSGIVINGTCSRLVITNNTVFDTRTGENRTINYIVEIQSYNNAAVPPRIAHNRGFNMYKGVISEFYGQLNYNLLIDNTATSY